MDIREKTERAMSRLYEQGTLTLDDPEVGTLVVNRRDGKFWIDWFEEDEHVRSIRTEENIRAYLEVRDWYKTLREIESL